MADGATSQYARAALQVLAILALVAVTNVELPARAALLQSQGRFGTLALTAAVWLVSLLALLLAVSHRSLWVRLGWGLLFGLAGAVAWATQYAAKLELSIFDVLGFWEARHEAGNAFATYGNAAVLGTLVFAVGALVLALPFVARALALRRLSFARAVLPALPIILIAAIIVQKGGNGHFGMPKQFAEVSIGGLAAARIATAKDSTRHEVALTPVQLARRPNILLLVDESLRPDYVSAVPGNRISPDFATFASGMVDFGQAAAGGICSNYSNAILRFMASRADVGGDIKTNATIWKYAKAAGYRTVFIDAQAQAINNTTHMQNFMTDVERKDIDAFYPLSDVAPAGADLALLDIVAKELASPQPVFIYANKQGMHFPYDKDYAAATARFHPTESEVPEKTLASMINSYRNAVDANVNGFFAQYVKRIPQNGLNVIYTSDHGQLFSPGNATHCKSSDTDPRMALVPLYAASADPAMMQALRAGAEKSKGRANHFQIMPTVLEWMGYAPADLAARYPESLTRGTALDPAYTVGDVMGVFSNDVTWQPIDLSQDYVEPEVRADDGKLAAKAACSAGAQCP